MTYAITCQLFFKNTNYAEEKQKKNMLLLSEYVICKFLLWRNVSLKACNRMLVKLAHFTLCCIRTSELMFRKVILRRCLHWKLNEHVSDIGLELFLKKRCGSNLSKYKFLSWRKQIKQGIVFFFHSKRLHRNRYML